MTLRKRRFLCVIFLTASAGAAAVPTCRTFVSKGVHHSVETIKRWSKWNKTPEGQRWVAKHPHGYRVRETMAALEACRDLLPTEPAEVTELLPPPLFPPIILPEFPAQSPPTPPDSHTPPSIAQCDKDCKDGPFWFVGSPVILGGGGGYSPPYIPIPEPSTLIQLVTGVWAGLAVWRRR